MKFVIDHKSICDDNCSHFCGAHCVPLAWVSSLQDQQKYILYKTSKIMYRSLNVILYSLHTTYTHRRNVKGGGGGLLLLWCNESQSLEL